MRNGARMCWMRWRVLATSAPKWAMVLSSSRKCKRGMRSAQLGGEGLSSWYGSKNRPDAGGREHRHGGLGLHTAADIHYGRAHTIQAARADVTDARFGDTGLFYSFKTTGQWPGRIRFVPWRQLALRP